MVETTKLYINGHDAETTWGLRLDGDDSSGYDALTAFRPMKEPVVNKNVTAQGAVIVCGTGILDERTVSVPVHIVAKSYTDYMAKKSALEAYLMNGEQNVTPKGKLNVVVKREWSTKVGGVTKKTEQTEFESVMYCLGCNQYKSFAAVQKKNYNWRTDTWSDVPNTGYGIAKFVLSLYEPNEPTT